MNVRDIYVGLVKEGYSEKDAAKEAQARTGISLVTGRPIGKQLGWNKRSYVYGQYRIKK